MVPPYTHARTGAIWYEHVEPASIWIEIGVRLIGIVIVDARIACIQRCELRLFVDRLRIRWDDGALRDEGEGGGKRRKVRGACCVLTSMKDGGTAVSYDAQ